MSGGAHFGCGHDDDVLAAELADLVHGSWKHLAGIRGVMIMPNGARVPRTNNGRVDDDGS